MDHLCTVQPVSTGNAGDNNRWLIVWAILNQLLGTTRSRSHGFCKSADHMTPIWPGANCFFSGSKEVFHRSSHLHAGLLYASTWLRSCRPVGLIFLKFTFLCHSSAFQVDHSASISVRFNPLALTIPVTIIIDPLCEPFWMNKLTPIVLVPTVSVSQPITWP